MLIDITIDGILLWRCPTCGQTNEEEYGETPQPLCWACGDGFEWAFLLTAAQLTEVQYALSSHRAARVLAQ